MNETDLNNQTQKEQRQQKLAKKKASGKLNTNRTARSEKKFSLAGRILGIRGQGKTTFIDLWEAHFRLQLYLGEKILGEEQLKNYDLGDSMFILILINQITQSKRY